MDNIVAQREFVELLQNRYGVTDALRPAGIRPMTRIRTARGIFQQHASVTVQDIPYQRHFNPDGSASGAISPNAYFSPQCHIDESAIICCYVGLVGAVTIDPGMFLEPHEYVLSGIYELDGLKPTLSTLSCGQRALIIQSAS